jgi:hypothetical protein
MPVRHPQTHEDEADGYGWRSQCYIVAAVTMDEKRREGALGHPDMW